MQNENTKPTEGALRVWHCPQICAGEIPIFTRPVASIAAGKELIDTLAEYDLFQFNNRIKPDYSNTSGLEVFFDGEWTEWDDPEYGDDITEIDMARAIELDRAAEEQE